MAPPEDIVVRKMSGMDATGKGDDEHDPFRALLKKNRRTVDTKDIDVVLAGTGRGRGAGLDATVNTNDAGVR
jgi:hypothetical protein